MRAIVAIKTGACSEYFGQSFKIVGYAPCNNPQKTKFTLFIKGERFFFYPKEILIQDLEDEFERVKAVYNSVKNPNKTICNIYNSLQGYLDARKEINLCLDNDKDKLGIPNTSLA